MIDNQFIKKHYQHDIATEAAIVSDLKVFGIDNIKQVIDYFDKDEPLEERIVDTRKEFYKNL